VQIDLPFDNHCSIVPVPARLTAPEIPGMVG